MKTKLLAAAGILALSSGLAYAEGKMPFPVGEGDFNWESYEALKSMQLDGEQVTVFGPWLGPDQEVAENVLFNIKFPTVYFHFNIKIINAPRTQLVFYK